MPELFLLYREWKRIRMFDMYAYYRYIFPQPFIGHPVYKTQLRWYLSYCKAGLHLILKITIGINFNFHVFISVHKWLFPRYLFELLIKI